MASIKQSQWFWNENSMIITGMKNKYVNEFGKEGSESEVWRVQRVEVEQGSL
jgi:hypothetical protein